MVSHFCCSTSPPVVAVLLSWFCMFNFLFDLFALVELLLSLDLCLLPLRALFRQCVNWLWQGCVLFNICLNWLCTGLLSMLFLAFLAISCVIQRIVCVESLTANIPTVVAVSFKSNVVLSSSISMLNLTLQELRPSSKTLLIFAEIDVSCCQYHTIDLALPWAFHAILNLLLYSSPSLSAFLSVSCSVYPLNAFDSTLAKNCASQPWVAPIDTLFLGV